MAKTKTRCAWAESDDLMRAYHDEEWGRPVRDSRALWEMLNLEGFQAGLSWSVILKKREAFRKAFKGWDPKAVARMTKRDVDRLMQDEGIVRARAKIEAMIGNAKAFSRCRTRARISPRWSGGWLAESPFAEAKSV